MSMFCKKAVDHEFNISGGYSAEFDGWTAKTADIGTAIRQIPTLSSFLCWKVRFKNQVNYVMDRRSGVVESHSSSKQGT